MRRSPFLTGSFLVLGLCLGSCSQDATAPPPLPPPPQTGPGPASGHWTANGPDFISTLDLGDTVVITTRNGTVKGSGTFTGPGIVGGGGAFAVGGTDSSGSIRLSFTATGHATAYFSGQMAGDTEMDGNLDSSGFNHLALKFTHNPVVVSITVAPHSDSTLPKYTVQFTDSAFDLLGRALAPQPVTWSTSDPTRAIISASGLLTAIAPGSVTVSASNHGVVGQAQINVLRPVVSVVITPPTVRLVVPTTVPLTATLLDTTGSVITGRVLTWSSSDGGVASVAPSGAVTARATGSADIRATASLDGRNSAAHVTVRTVQLTQITAGANHTCGVAADSSVACWGDGEVGQLGAAVRTTVTAPLLVNGSVRFSAVSAGHVHTCGLAVDSAAYCWGGDGAGQLGDGNSTSDTVPVAVVGGLKFVALAVGYDHTCGLVAGGNAYCWGSNLSGEMGIGSTSQAPNPNPVSVTGGLSFASLAAGNAHTCGLTSDSTAYCWGGNAVGTLGDSTTTSHDVPTLVAGGLKFAAISAGAFHTCAITGAGDAYCWGNNASGELGDSSGTTQQDAPVAVHAAGVLFTSIAAGFNHTCARALSGQIYCWGGNDNGQVGPNAGTVAYLPVLVGLTGTAIVAGGFHSCAMTPNGTYCWGYNQLGQLGAGSALAQSATPLRVSGQP
jgi:Regulator of Chromosome Condensation (RCC1) repeat protein/Big-like domain-containing protein